MTFVVDASITACWAFRDEDHPSADMALTRLRIEEALAPGLWWFEVRNILVVNERRKRLTEAESAVFLRSLVRLPITVDHAPDESEVLRLARTHQLSVYDAAYLELAQRNRIGLATLDLRLARAARAEAVPVIGENT